MTRKQKLLLEQSEKRQKINELLDKEDRSADENTELETLTARMQAMEPELRAAIVAEGAAETRDRLDFGDDAQRPRAARSGGRCQRGRHLHRDPRTPGDRRPDRRAIKTHFGLAPNQVSARDAAEPESRRAP